MHQPKFIVSLLIVAFASVTLQMAIDDDIDNNDRMKREISSTSVKIASASVPVMDGSLWTSLKRQATDEVAGSNETATSRSLLPGGTFPNTPQCVYSTNCNFIGIDLYVVVNILSPITCGNVICGGDNQCTHFVYDPISCTCYLKRAVSSGGGWATPTPVSTPLTCGHIPARSCGSGALISLCLGLGIGIL